jgi:hypothetical protein
MSECSCVYVDYGDPMPEFYTTRKPTAKKEHKCCECHRTIKPSEKYEYVSGLWEKNFLILKTCSDCLSIRNEFFCEGWLYEDMKEALQEHLNSMDGNINEDCLSALTPGARVFVCNMIEEIWEDFYDNMEDS